MAALSCPPSSRRARDVPEMCPRRLGRPSKRIPASQEPPLRAFPLWEGGFAQGNPSKTSVKPPLTPTGETTRPGHMPAPSGGGGLAGRDGDKHCGEPVKGAHLRRSLRRAVPQGTRLRATPSPDPSTNCQSASLRVCFG